MANIKLTSANKRQITNIALAIKNNTSYYNNIFTKDTGSNIYTVECTYGAHNFKRIKYWVLKVDKSDINKTVTQLPIKCVGPFKLDYDPDIFIIPESVESFIIKFNRELIDEVNRVLISKQLANNEKVNSLENIIDKTAYQILDRIKLELSETDKKVVGIRTNTKEVEEHEMNALVDYIVTLESNGNRKDTVLRINISYDGLM